MQTQHTNQRERQCPHCDRALPRCPTTTETARHFGVSPRTIERMAAEGLIPVSRLGLTGRSPRYDLRAVEEALIAQQG